MTIMSKEDIDDCLDTIADRDKQISDLRAKVSQLELKLHRPFPDVKEPEVRSKTNE